MRPADSNTKRDSPMHGTPHAREAYEAYCLSVKNALYNVWCHF